MANPKHENILKVIGKFYEELKSYDSILKHLAESKTILGHEIKEQEVMRENLVRKTGMLKKIIVEVTSKQYYTQFGSRNDMWDEAFNPSSFLPFNRTALAFCITATNEAIGKLEIDIEKGLRDEQGNVIGQLRGISGEPPKAFIAHGGKSGVLDKLREFIQALGIDPLIVELLPTKGMSVDDKVKKYIHEAHCGIVLATRGGIIDKKAKKQHPRLNVIDEFERLRAVFPDKTILLLEKGVELPSNISGLTYESFARQSMDRAFTAIARELTELKILKAVKPQTKEQTS